MDPEKGKENKENKENQEDDGGQNREMLMEEAIKILNQEGFSLPGDVVDTLYTVGRSNAAARRRGALRAHKMSEFESRAKKFRNKRETSAKRNQGRTTPEAKEPEPQPDVKQNVTTAATSSSSAENATTTATVASVESATSEAVESATSEATVSTAEAASSQDNSSTCAYSATVTTSGDATSASTTSTSGDVTTVAADTVATKAESDTITETSVASTTTSKIEEQDLDDVFLQESIEKNARAKLEREESAEESSSTCSASTVREIKEPGNRNLVERQDSTSSIESSASSMNKMKGLGRLESVGSDTGYSTSIENVVQTREAKAENLKNMNKATAEQQGQKFNNGLRRDLSRDSGFTEAGFQSCQSPVTPIPNEAKSLATQDFNDMTISNSDVSEKFISSDNGEAHVVTSAASDLTAAEMTTNGDAITEDGTAVSSRAKLENQESNSTLLRVTNKATDEEVSKEDDYESVSQTSKSSRNDSISTSASGQQTAASRHAASMEQGLYKERSKLATSQDGSRVAADMYVDQQLTRNQEMNNSEQVDDGTSKNEAKKTTEKSLTSKSLREEKLLNQDGSVAGSITSSQNMDSNLRCSEIDETLTKADGSVVKRKDDNSTSTMKESSTTEKKSVKQLPYGGGKSTEIVKKSDNSSVSNTSKVQSERNETASGVSEKKHEEDSKSMSSSFSGVCESEEVVNGLTLKRMQSSEQSSESKVKSSRSVSSYNSRASVADAPENPPRERRLSDASDVSNFSNISKENINPPTYEETMSNLSRHGSIGSLSSGYSRQDSSASSIASSAGAFNERQRQKMLEKEALNRENSFENEPDYRGRDFGRQDSFSSDSTISAGNEYEGREIVHPIRKVDSHHAYGRSLTDSAIGHKVNRRATLDGDIVITDKELRRAREDVRSNIRGRDDSFIDRGGIFETQNSGKRDKFGDFGSFGSGSFKKDIMNMVDRFFDDDDDDFGIGFGRNRRKRDTRSIDDPLTARRREDNPYTMRDDLSKFRREQEMVRGEAVDVEYAASDSGYHKPSRRSRVEELETDFTDVASDSGHNRFGSSSSSRRESDDFNYSKNFGQSNCRSASRGSQDNNYQYSHLSNRVSAISADDILHSAGKSIHGDRNINTSISESCENITRPRINNNSFDNRNYSQYQNTRDDDYTNVRDSNSDMNEALSASSLHQVSRDAQAHTSKRLANTDDYRTRSSRKEVGRSRSNQQTHSEDRLVHEESEKWNDRRHRIDKALSWIRGELGVLRTQDKVLMSQFQRCQDSIEELKKQKPWYEVFSDDEYDDDEYEDGGRHWEDWEIDEFDRRDRETNLRSSALTSDSRRNYTSSKSSQRPSAVFTKDSQRFSMTTIE
ncbi:hypothetical protein ACF0H5_023163 [Mactra antiquata]